MKTSNTNSQVRDYFRDVRRVIKNAHRDIDAVYRDADNKRKRIQPEKYQADYRDEWERKTRTAVVTDLAAIRSVACSQVDSLFALIKDEVKKWSVEPLGASLTESLSVHRTFDMEASVMELQSLVEQAQGSYYGMKVVDMLAKQRGLRTGYVPLEQLDKDLRSAQADSKTAINKYVGALGADHKFVGQTYEDAMDGAWYQHPFAASFLEKEDSSLARVEAELLDATVRDFDILPSTRREIDALFADADEQKRIDIAVRLIESNDRFADLLPLYDKALYDAAQDAIDQAKKDRALQAMQNYTEARSEAQKAIQASAAASRKQESFL